MLLVLPSELFHAIVARLNARETRMLAGSSKKVAMMRSFGRLLRLRETHIVCGRSSAGFGPRMFASMLAAFSPSIADVAFALGCGIGWEVCLLQV